MCDAAFACDWELALRIHEHWLPLRRRTSWVPEPCSVKAAMSMLGLCSDTLRMPLMPPRESHRARLRLIMEAAGLLDPDNLVAIGSAGRASASAMAAHA